MAKLDIKKALIEQVENEVQDQETTKTKNNELQKLNPSLTIKQKFNNMFIYMRDSNVLEEVRAGLHASAVIDTDGHFCYREQVLSLVYEMSQGKDLPVGALKIFAAGSSIHEKWQNMFAKCSNNISGFKLVKTEARSFSKKYNLFFTPDAIVEINGTKYIVEIKSMNTFSYKHAAISTNPHPHARHQIQLYMHLTGIHNGLILIEDKNAQEFEVFPIKYDYRECIPYLNRLQEINKQYKDLIENGIEPEGICNKETCKRAQECNMREACFHIEEAKKLNFNKE